MANSWKQLSDSMAAGVEAASQYTVRVEGRRRLPATGIVWSADGVILTTHHAITREEELRVGLPDGSVVPAALVGRDPSRDIAVLRVEADGLAVPRWGDELAVGQMVLALGRPGQTVRAALGIISALGGTWHTPAGGHVERYIQPDVVMYPGFSGGPLIDASGNVLGMNTSALLRGSDVTLPSQTLRHAVETLLEHGHIRRGYLGVALQPVRLPADLAEKLGQETGLLVLSVEQGSPAEASGLLLGDSIVAVDGSPVRHIDELHAQLTEQRIGNPIRVQIVRGGEARDVDVVVGTR
jgi:S1-C subfamily serine protease